MDFNKIRYNSMAGAKAEWTKSRGDWDVRKLRQQEASAIGEIWKRDSAVIGTERRVKRSFWCERIYSKGTKRKEASWREVEAMVERGSWIKCHPRGIGTRSGAQVEALAFSGRVSESEAGGERLDETFSLPAERDISWEERI